MSPRVTAPPTRPPASAVERDDLAVGRRVDLYLHPGQVFASRCPARVTTVLGSCVAVCLWDRHSAVGGINHYLLPDGAADGPSPLRFGSVATPALIDEILALGAHRSGLQAKVFGGACIAVAFRGQGKRHLGAANVQSALATLAAAGIPVEARDTEGRRGRKLVFQTDGGSAWVKPL